MGTVGNAIKDTVEGVYAVATSSEARAGFAQGWNEQRVQPLADRLQAKAEFRNIQGDPGLATGLALGVEDMIGAKIPEAYFYCIRLDFRTSTHGGKRVE